MQASLFVLLCPGETEARLGGDGRLGRERSARGCPAGSRPRAVPCGVAPPLWHPPIAPPLSPQRSDPRLLSQFFFADERVTRVVAEINGLDAELDPQQYLVLLNQLHLSQVRRRSPPTPPTPVRSPVPPGVGGGRG